MTAEPTPPTRGLPHLRAITGLLAICLLLAISLVVTALLSYRATRASAEAVLHSRASEVAASVAATARITGAMHDEELLAELVERAVSEGIGIVVTDVKGHVITSAPPAANGAAPIRPDQIAALRARGQAHRMRTGTGGRYLEYWRPLGGFGRMWRRHVAHLPPHRSAPPPKAGRPWPSPFWRGRFTRGRLLRVTASMSLADHLIRPARYAVALSAAAAVLLLVLGVGMYRSAKRAWHTQKELQRRQAMAALGEMGAVLAHEIRTPLSSIKGNAQLVAESQAEDERITAVVREAERLERLVNGLLDYARPTPPRPDAVDPDQIAARAVEIVAPLARAASVPILTDPASCGACLRADGDQLLQVLVNLLQNGVEANATTTAAAKPVTLRVQRKLGRVLFEVLDRGPGLGGADPDDLTRPFHTSKAGGTGLGLSIAKQIVEAHGGRVELVDREGGGVVATVSLPSGQTVAS